MIEVIQAVFGLICYYAALLFVTAYAWTQDWRLGTAASLYIIFQLCKTSVAMIAEDYDAEDYKDEG